MTDPLDNELEQRCLRLEKQARFWKWLALAQLVALALVLILGLASVVRMATLAAQQGDRALAAEQMAREQAKQAHKAMEKLKERTK